MIEYLKIVAAWTRQCLHYGNTVTSRTESLHSALKTVLRHSIHPKDVVDAFSRRLWDCLVPTEGTSLTVDDFNAHWNIRRGDLTPVDYIANSGPGASDLPGQAAECSYQSFHEATSFPL